MSTTFQPLYGSSGSFTATALNGLASGAYWASGLLNLQGASPPPEDVEIYVDIATGSSGFSATTSLPVYAYASDDGTNATDGAPAAAGTYTPAAAANLKYIGTIALPANSTTYAKSVFSLLRAFGAFLPRYAGIVIGPAPGALGSSGCAASYRFVNGQGTP